MEILTTMKCKCLNPTVAWKTGMRCAKDGILSPVIEFSSTAALEWYESRFGVLGLQMMAENEISLPCNKCAACKLRQRRDLSTRLSQEASCYEDKCYLTLTYDGDHLPMTDGDNPTLVVSHVQRFIKRLRRHLEYHKLAGKIRYFAVGEYGSKAGRPHYHILIFGWRPSDLELFFVRGGINYYRSPTIEKLWRFGYSTVEDVNAYACRYCARYVTKKFVTQKELSDCQLPEFILRSCRNGGTGSPWFDRFGKAACELGFTTYRLKDLVVKAATPRYYYTRLRKFYPDDYVRIREGKILWLKNHRNVGSFDALQRHVETELYRMKTQMENETL